MKTIERRAVDIAATVMYRAGLCRYDSPVKCRKTEIPNECACIRCIEAWLLARAKREMGKTRAGQAAAPTTETEAADGGH